MRKILTVLLVVFMTELVVRLKSGAAGGNAALDWLERGKGGLYVLILAIAFYWGSKEQYLYLWDELIWVLGFLVIDWNIRDWQSWKRTMPDRTFSTSPR